jgi:hypothetical protein
MIDDDAGGGDEDACGTDGQKQPIHDAMPLQQPTDNLCTLKAR